jgi:hypothetical protein
MHTTSIVQAPSLTLASGVTIPDSTMACEVTELVRNTENSLLFNHSTHLPSPFWGKANNFRGLFEFLPYHVATKKLAFIENFS